jgi:beta-glucosidase
MTMTSDTSAPAALPATPSDDDLSPLLRRLTLEQKVRLLTGADFWALHAEPVIGLRRIVLSDGPSGIRGESWDDRRTALNLPSATALGATWDPELARRYGGVLAAEARRAGADVVLGPTINLHRSPLGGRHFEAYSEDPLLTSRLAAAYVRGVQDGGVGATPKHYVANDFETERFTADVVVSDRALRELYLAAFEETVVQERPWLVMAAYNSVNGATMTENPLLAEPLAGEWGFDGVVVSDWWAARTTEPAALARLDLVMPGPGGPWGEQLVEAVRSGRVPEDAVDQKVLRILRLAARVGALDGFAPAVAAPSGPATDPEATLEAGRALAREVAAAGTVLVRNADELPWAADTLRSVAVIGHNAFLARTQGGGSALVEPERTVSPLDGLRAALPHAEVTWSLGAVAQPGLAPLPLADLTDPVSGEPGIRAVFRDADGGVVHDENRRTADLARLGSDRLGTTATIEVSTRYVPREPGEVRLGVAGAGHAVLTVDGRTLVETTLVHTGQEFGGGLVAPPSASAPVTLTAGVPVDVVVRLALPERERPDSAVTLTLGLDLGQGDADAEIAAAAGAARAADVAVVVVGTSAEVESEGFDRTTLALPGRQDDLVRAVAAANPRTVVPTTTTATSPPCCSPGSAGRSTGTRSPTCCSASSSPAVACPPRGPAPRRTCPCSTPPPSTVRCATTRASTSGTARGCGPATCPPTRSGTGSGTPPGGSTVCRRRPTWSRRPGSRCASRPPIPAPGRASTWSRSTSRDPTAATRLRAAAWTWWSDPCAGSPGSPSSTRSRARP